jgi:Icc-related predicted phosphoesterase
VLRILAVADEIREYLYGPALKEMEADLIVSCGDLPFEYLEYLVTMSGIPLLYVLGNHDPAIRKRRPMPQDLMRPEYLDASHRPAPGPQGCTSVEGRWVDVAGLRVAGLGGSPRYSEGPNQYTEREMQRKVGKLIRHARVAGALGGRKIDLFITHAPPLGVGDQDDPAHRGFESFHRVIRSLKPRSLVHGHVHPYGDTLLDHRVRETDVLNTVGYRILEFER